MSEHASFSKLHLPAPLLAYSPYITCSMVPASLLVSSNTRSLLADCFTRPWLTSISTAAKQASQMKKRKNYISRSSKYSRPLLLSHCFSLQLCFLKFYEPQGGFNIMSCSRILWGKWCGKEEDLRELMCVQLPTSATKNRTQLSSIQDHKLSKSGLSRTQSPAASTNHSNPGCSVLCKAHSHPSFDRPLVSRVSS